MQAPQVVQAHSSSSITAFGTMGRAASSPTRRRSSPSPCGCRCSSVLRSCMIFFGESALPVMLAGHTSWQRPHSVQE